MEQHRASHVLHVTEPTCTDAVLIKVLIWLHEDESLKATVTWEAAAAEKNKQTKKQAFMNILEDALE